MKNLFFPLFTLLTISFSLNAQEFEGIVKVKNNAEQGYNMTITKKGHLSLIETTTSEGDLQILFDETTGDMTTVTEKDGEKMAVKVNSETNPYIKSMKQLDQYKERAKDVDAEITITEDTRMIRGYLCVKVLGKDAEAEGIAWVAKDLDLDMSDLIPQAKMYLGGRKPMHELTGVEGFIMELTMKNLKTGEEYFMENEVIEKEISDEVFSSVIAGADVLDTTDMQKMMQEAAKDPAKMQQFKEMMKKYQRGN